MQRADSLEKTLIFGKTEGRRRRGWQDETVGWHHWLNGHEFEQALGDDEGQGSLECCSPWGLKELGTTEQLQQFQATNIFRIFSFNFFFIILDFICSSIIHFELLFYMFWGTDQNFLLSVQTSNRSRTTCWKDDLFSTQSAFEFLSKINCLYICVDLFLFSFVDKLSVFMPVSHCFGYYGFMIVLKSCNISSSTSFFFQVVFIILGSLHLHMNFRISLQFPPQILGNLIWTLNL